jgi:hypothetical protein
MLYQFIVAATARPRELKRSVALCTCRLRGEIMPQKPSVYLVVLVATLLCFGVALAIAGGSISGTVSQVGGRVIEPSVALTQYKDSDCAGLAEKKDKTKIESDKLGACRKENFRTTKGDRAGIFEFTDVPAGWYSLTISWPQGNVAVTCSESPSDWKIRHMQRGDAVFVVATTSAFELKATDKLEKDLNWCP